jgi:hypothetical protein
MKTGILTSQFMNAGIVKIEGDKNLVTGLNDKSGEIKGFEL